MEQYSDSYWPAEQSYTAAEPVMEQQWWFGDDACASRYRMGYIAFLLFELIITTVVYFASSAASWQSATRFAIAINILIFFSHGFYRVICKPVNYLGPDLFYVLFYILFNMGYLLLWFFKIVPTTSFIFHSPQLFPKVMYIVNLGLLGFLLGYEWGAPNRFKRSDMQTTKLPAFGWEASGLFLMGFALAIHFIYIFLIIGVGTFITHGYEVFTNIERFTTVNKLLWVQQPNIFVGGFTIYIICIALIHKKLFRGKLGLILFIIQTYLLVLEGARTAVAGNVVVLLLVRHYLIRPIKLKWILTFMLVMMFIFSSIRIVRNITALDIGKMIAELKYAKKSGEAHWYDSIAEMGGSVRTVNMTVELVPDEFPYWYGRSYINSSIHIVPFLQGVVARLFGGYWTANVSDWLTFTLGGRGVAGLGYINFGFVELLLYLSLIPLTIQKEK